ncbi:solute carrier family 25 member 53 [Sphaerodactylus townsendi]|uniref:solute carrier family 25 member 53 n=1 Tax=Sphaerodactylus townsendi TaxID=933632 RepID=UPI0020267DF0|nr:solute carrier family 25 member 53 [Sphaerodactylus townsendi]XP_048370502.1 solute carrier family 25 member 53 [Sphaerodactylus townsendi]
MPKEVGTSGSTGKGEQRRDKPSWGSHSYNMGAASGFLATLATFPIYKTIFRQQLHAFSIQEAVRQLSQEGLHRFYRGVFPPLLSRTVQGTLMFGTYESCLHILSCRSSRPHSLGDRYTAGLVSGILEALVLCPFERIQNVLQDGRKNKRFPATHSILQEFHSYAPRETLVLGYYRGLGLILVRNGLGSSLYFSLKDPLQDSLSERGLPRWLPALISGSVNGTLICLFLYPLSVLIANVQSQVGKQEILHFQAAVTAVWGNHGRSVALLYRGGSLLILRSCLTWGLTTAIYDFLQQSTV